MASQGSDTLTAILKRNSSNTITSLRLLKMAPKIFVSIPWHSLEFSGRQRECRFYTAGCVNKMAVSVTGPRAVNELGGQDISGRIVLSNSTLSSWTHVFNLIEVLN